MEQYWLAIVVLSCVLGYAIGRLSVLSDKLRDQPAAPSVFNGYGARTKSVAPQQAVEAVQIDDRKFVTAVTTAGMTKAEDVQLGVTQTKQDDINAAANKLAQLKRS